ncbi:MAG: hypothetical protein JEZ06_10460 [Anaerolineaceae bacterium]|nr:hypothetical protein [Anaerolineaceae bacterium]
MENKIYSNRINQVASQAAASKQNQADVQEIQDSFTSHLNERIKFSNHAQKRLERRSIDLNEGDINRLATAVEKAEAHGGKESLILMDDLAFIVNVQEKMVVTTMNKDQQKKGVFTQIDSVVIADAYDIKS